MGKTIPTIQNRFDGGMVNDIRSTRSNVCRLAKNFDILTFPHKLVPIKSTESGNDTPATYINIENFCYVNTTNRLYALAVTASNSTNPKIFFKDMSTTAGDGTWSTPANNTGTLGRYTEFFTYYATAGAIYLAQIGAFSKFVVGSPAFTDSNQSVTISTSVSNGIVHSKDDILYVGYDNKIASNSYYSGSDHWTVAALTLPSNMLVKSICEYGNYLAIGCSDGIVSRVYLWDRDSSLTTLAETIDWGSGILSVLEEYNGTLVGISSSNGRLQVREYLGQQGAVLRLQLNTSNSGLALNSRKQKKDGRIYFLANFSFTEANTLIQYIGLWSVGKNQAGEWSLSLAQTANNDTDPNSLYGFYITPNDYTFIAYNDGLGTEQVSKTDDSASAYTASSIFETIVYNDGDSSVFKKPLGVTITYEPLPTNGQVVLKYKKDTETSWTTIFTDTTDNALSHSSVRVEATGATFGENQEIRFQLISTGGAVITGISFESEIISKKPY